MSIVQSLSDLSKIMVREDVVLRAMEDDPYLRKCFEFDFSALVEEIKCRLFPLVAGETVNKRVANEFVELAKGFKLLITTTIGTQRRRKGLNGIEMDSDDLYNCQLFCLLLAAAGTQRVNLSVFTTKLSTEKVLEMGIDMTPEEEQRYETMQGLSKFAQEWLASRKIIPDIIPWDRSNFSVKILVLGPTRVGKTTLLLRLKNGDYEPYSQATTGVDYITRRIELPNKCKVEINLWDTAGSERFECLTKSIMREVDGVMLVYDASDPAMTADAVMGDHKESLLWRHYLKHREEEEFAPIVYFGNKTDLPVSHPYLEVDSGRATHFTGSAKTGDNVERAFQQLFYTTAMFKYNRRKMPGGSAYSASYRNVLPSMDRISDLTSHTGHSFCC